MRPATFTEQKYLDLAVQYTERAMTCREHKQWHEAATNFGSVLESLLRIRFGPGKCTLAALLDKFDKDPLFDCIAIHEDGEQKCATCFADRVRVLRNAVHPNCWITATEKDADNAAAMVSVLHHILVACPGSRIADFQERPDSPLVRMEQSGIAGEAAHQVDHERLKVQSHESNKADGLLDVVLTGQPTGEETFDTVAEPLHREEEEAEDADRK
ncbi:MAG: hypothetical protein WBD87_15720 [Candidatus Acidiferrales bacterium]